MGSLGINWDNWGFLEMTRDCSGLLGITWDYFLLLGDNMGITRDQLGLLENIWDYTCDNFGFI